MDELLKALKSFKPKSVDDNFYIEIKNKEIVALRREPNQDTVKVSQQDFKFLLDNGIDYFVYDHEIIRKPKKKTERVFDILKKDVRGYDLQDSDPYWPTEIVQGGFKWQTPSE